MVTAVTSMIREVAPTSRKMRRPSHPFQVRSRPFQIQPFFLAPVLPGETMKNLLLQSRVVSDPIVNPLIGWWAEYYLFYVKHRDLDERDDLTSLMLEPDYSLAALATAADPKYYHGGSGVNWAKLCLKRVVEEYFRDEGVAWDTYALDGMPLAQINNSSWLDSVTFPTATAAEGEPNPELSPAFDAYYQQWEFMQANKLTDMTYEDFLKTYGVSVKEEAVKKHKPELIRYLKDWTYPSNTVDPTTGTPSSACSWAIAERADKDRFFSEPGWLFGVSVVRPKVYLSKVTGALAHNMDTAFNWLPAVLKDEVYTSLKSFAEGAGPIPTAVGASGYWVDIRDLLMYGDQFVNFALTETDAGLVALPTTALQKKYPSSADVDALFKVAASNKIKQDGVVSLAILGSQIDHT